MSPDLCLFILLRHVLSVCVCVFFLTRLLCLTALSNLFFMLERKQVPIHNGAGTRAQPWVTLMTKKRPVQYTQTPPFNNAPSSRRASSDRLHGNCDNGAALFHIGARVHYTGGLARFSPKRSTTKSWSALFSPFHARSRALARAACVSAPFNFNWFHQNNCFQCGEFRARVTKPVRDQRVEKKNTHQ